MTLAEWLHEYGAFGGYDFTSPIHMIDMEEESYTDRVRDLFTGLSWEERLTVLYGWSPEQVQMARSIRRGERSPGDATAR